MAEVPPGTNTSSREVPDQGVMVERVTVRRLETRAVTSSRLIRQRAQVLIRWYLLRICLPPAATDPHLLPTILHISLPSEPIQPGRHVPRRSLAQSVRNIAQLSKLDPIKRSLLPDKSSPWKGIPTGSSTEPGLRSEQEGAETEPAANRPPHRTYSPCHQIHRRLKLLSTDNVQGRDGPRQKRKKPIK